MGPRPEPVDGPAQPNQPWSPFPVQDWQTLAPATRGDPHAGPPESAWVNPAWAPPRDPKRSWLPLLVISLVTCLVATGFYVADRFGEQDFASSAQAFVPDDGAVSYSERKTRSPQRTDRAQFVTESARLTGVTALTALDFTFSSKLLTSLGSDSLLGTPFWRTTTTEVGHPISSQQLVRLYRASSAVELVGESGPGVAHIYRPALIELPGDVAAGSTWSGSGSAGDVLTYRSEFRADAADGGCLRVTGTIAYVATSGQPGTTTSVEKTWCPASGITTATSATGATTITEVPVAGPAGGRRGQPERRTVGDPVAWTAPQAWKREAFTTISIDQNFGQQMMTGTPGSVPPVLTASGLVIRASSASDLIAFTPKTPNQWTSLWRMHPGGTLLSLSAFGDIVVATTSRRQIVAYADTGVRLWQHDLDELAFRAPVRVTNDAVALVDGAGTVRLFDIRTGTVRWRRDVGVEVVAAPIGDPRAVVIFDADGSATAFEPETGDELWRRELEVNRATVVGDTLVTQNASTLTALSVATGTSRWLQVVTGTVDDLQAFDGDLVMATQLGTTILNEDGTVRSRRPPYERLTVTGAHLVGWGIREAEILDRQLATVLTLDTPDRNLSSSEVLPLADRFGLFLFAGDWSFQTWSDQP